MNPRLNATVDEVIAILALVRASGGGSGSSGLGGNFQVISSSTSLTGTPNAVTWLLVDSTAAPITLGLPAIAQSANVLFTIVDRFNTSSIHPITFTCPATVECWDPQNPGSYAASVSLADPTGSPLRLKYDSVLKLWLPW